ncbi:conserved Plasmodium protein, unknown function [Plasmodium berghei]|uniref:Uncharacterized protein n=2 Tax=Plasmodium berghei TaxID=5821 RepID=A0A509AKJ4_PLABA|nr:conserved Plasmodium protein, unknown function [Plasmodium berghei ANKA]SCL91715.1 conserved Plasmodium protein, unknown function [Plasmodium berghei]SCM15519.1 conserved Plasmodium protein, unknown function [Plasmodium berghei]SCN22514.1 conserved Plasmodium protein, unknown function [Plasmodium berghei]VUC54284.1 conserved Plasmodium protein, unknown function [Plasmodium berghei ANKA]|eukprot:XP_034420117.1 conserved Plasmodium protein, unknown function [Plasmodium berghei ANKA]
MNNDQGPDFKLDQSVTSNGLFTVIERKPLSSLENNEGFNGNNYGDPLSNSIEGLLKKKETENTPYNDNICEIYRLNSSQFLNDNCENTISRISYVDDDVSSFYDSEKENELYFDNDISTLGSCYSAASPLKSRNKKGRSSYVINTRRSSSYDNTYNSYKQKDSKNNDNEEDENKNNKYRRKKDRDYILNYYNNDKKDEKKERYTHDYKENDKTFSGELIDSKNSNDEKAIRINKNIYRIVNLNKSDSIDKENFIKKITKIRKSMIKNTGYDNYKIESKYDDNKIKRRQSGNYNNPDLKDLKDVDENDCIKGLSKIYFNDESGNYTNYNRFSEGYYLKKYKNISRYNSDKRVGYKEYDIDREHFIYSKNDKNCENLENDSDHNYHNSKYKDRHPFYSYVHNNSEEENGENNGYTKYKYHEYNNRNNDEIQINRNYDINENIQYDKNINRNMYGKNVLPQKYEKYGQYDKPEYYIGAKIKHYNQNNPNINGNDCKDNYMYRDEDNEYTYNDINGRNEKCRYKKGNHIESGGEEYGEKENINLFENKKMYFNRNSKEYHYINEIENDLYRYRGHKEYDEYKNNYYKNYSNYNSKKMYNNMGYEYNENDENKNIYERATRGNRFDYDQNNHIENNIYNQPFRASLKNKEYNDNIYNNNYNYQNEFYYNSRNSEMEHGNNLYKDHIYNYRYDEKNVNENKRGDNNDDNICSDMEKGYRYSSDNKMKDEKQDASFFNNSYNLNDKTQLNNINTNNESDGIQNMNNENQQNNNPSNNINQQNGDVISTIPLPAVPFPTSPLSTTPLPTVPMSIPTIPTSGSVPFATIPVSSVVPSVVPGAVSSAVPGAVPSVVPGAVPSVVPGAVSSAVPGAVSSAVPGAVSSVVPGAVSSVVPGAVPGVVPSVVPGAVAMQGISLSSQLPINTGISIPGQIPINTTGSVGISTEVQSGDQQSQHSQVNPEQPVKRKRGRPKLKKTPDEVQQNENQNNIASYQIGNINNANNNLMNDMKHHMYVTTCNNNNTTTNNNNLNPVINTGYNNHLGHTINNHLNIPIEQQIQQAVINQTHGQLLNYQINNSAHPLSGQISESLAHQLSQPIATSLVHPLVSQIEQHANNQINNNMNQQVSHPLVQPLNHPMNMNVNQKYNHHIYGNNNMNNPMNQAMYMLPNIVNNNNNNLKNNNFNHNFNQNNNYNMNEDKIGQMYNNSFDNENGNNLDPNMYYRNLEQIKQNNDNNLYEEERDENEFTKNNIKYARSAVSESDDKHSDKENKKIHKRRGRPRKSDVESQDEYKNGKNNFVDEYNNKSDRHNDNSQTESREESGYSTFVDENNKTISYRVAYHPADAVWEKISGVKFGPMILTSQSRTTNVILSKKRSIELGNILHNLIYGYIYKGDNVRLTIGKESKNVQSGSSFFLPSYNDCSIHNDDEMGSAKIFLCFVYLN